MKFTSAGMQDLWLIEPTVLEDHRGYFFEGFNKKTFEAKTNLNIDFVQDNESKSTKGVLRGLHFQHGRYAQAKLVRVLQGEVQDVVVDLREGSLSYGKHYSVILSGKNRKQLFIPRGFAHGFLVLSDSAIFSYKCDNYYNKESEGGLLFNCPKLAISWELPGQELKLSEKDLVLSCFEG
ncbi:MAG: dTDP-4-dehydrorhamnose 3,5-epimerase [Chitinophagales bacterium]|tara:strand:+ start:6825 stop:7361 length:537 start_codon:yes stop_codon:yes gene_type:complete